MVLKRLFILTVMLSPTIAFGEYGVWKNYDLDLSSVWGGGQMIAKCNDMVNEIEISDSDKSDLTKGACIGKSRDNNCRAWNGTFTPAIEINGDEGAMLMMIARKVTKNGAYFCPTGIIGKNRGDPVRNAWMQHVDLTAQADHCIWLCQKGYIGEECEEKITTAKKCYDPTTKIYNAGVYSTYNISTSKDAEIFLFYQDSISCNITRTHDIDRNIILAVDRWDPNGHGAFVRQFTEASIAAHGKSPYESAPEIHTASGSKEVLVCLSGYEPNKRRTECVEAEQKACANGGNLFDKLTLKDQEIYEANPDRYTIVRNDDDKVILDCAKSGYGFSRGTHNCVECSVVAGKSGKNKYNECITCTGKGEIFSEKGSDGNYCLQSLALTKTELQYGKGKTGKTGNYKSECWAADGVAKYIECMK